MQDHDVGKERPSVKTVKAVLDESKLSEPQRKALAMAKAKGVPLIRDLDDLVPDLGLTSEEADHFGKTLDQIRKESRQNSAKRQFE